MKERSGTQAGHCETQSVAYRWDVFPQRYDPGEWKLRIYKVRYDLMTNKVRSKGMELLRMNLLVCRTISNATQGRV